MDGHIRIKTRIDNSEIPKDLDEMVKELERLKQEQKELNDEAKKLDLNAKDYEKNANKIQSKMKELEAEEQKLKAFQEYSFNQEEYNMYSKQLAEKQQEIALLKQEEDAYDKTLSQLEENKEAQTHWNKTIEETKEKLAHADSIKSAIGDIGTKIKGIFKQTLKWGLAIISVRSAYMMIRQTASTLSQYNEDLRNKIEGIRLALASALEPIITRLVDLIIELLRYVNAISVSLFGWDLFKNAKNMKSMSKSAKEIKNSLAGFDEMNVLGSTNAVGGGAGANVLDLSPKDLDTRIFYDWIDRVRDIILRGFDAIKQNVMKVFRELGVPNFLIRAWEVAFDTIKNIVGNTFTAIKGAFEFLIGFITGDTQKVKEGFMTMLKGVIGALSSQVSEGKKIIRVGIEEIQNLLKPITNWVNKNILKPIVNLFNTGLKTDLTNAMRGVANAIISILNSLINKLNLIVSPIRGLIVAIGKVLGKNYTMSNIKIPTIPKLATGGIVNRPTLANLGEGGYKEAVLPLDRNTEWMNELAKKINSNGGVVNVYLDGRLIQRQYNQRQEEFNFATNGGM